MSLSDQVRFEGSLQEVTTQLEDERNVLYPKVAAILGGTPDDILGKDWYAFRVPVVYDATGNNITSELVLRGQFSGTRPRVAEFALNHMIDTRRILSDTERDALGAMALSVDPLHEPYDRVLLHIVPLPERLRADAA